MRSLTILHLTFFLSFLFLSCGNNDTKPNTELSMVKVSGAMKNVMLKGELQGTVQLDSLPHKENLIAVGPLENLLGEILVIDGKSYISKVVTDSSMQVEENFKVKAPFLVYTRVQDWEQSHLPDSIRTIADLESYLDGFTKDLERPFAFKLTGIAKNALIHIQNLPPGTTVSSPQEAHSGQVSYLLTNERFLIGGFFSTSHQGIFTHHDSYLHMHLITEDRGKMGHLDELNIQPGTAKLYLARK
ncbi:alpha-acetolactate decarboxylase [Antarcticibacterium arcticum]|uniref:Alpha-acetolactate decarboxylase n=1 Tax=Antarcticibacterium arcticum TaxID=2585771 RepID=A0A5B8YHS9_9FLAO|nr:acetolactate decarboxylase [Antarcticibacterium arcticum]QED36588.1 alpha-acetolactate decarboxylase [Antarcticibacterium arcticum]